MDFDKVIKELTKEKYELYLSGGTRSTRVDKRSIEEIEEIFGDFKTAINYYYVFRFRNNLDTIC